MKAVDRTDLRQAISSLLRERGSRVLPVADIAGRLDNSLQASRDEVAAIVEEMERTGELVALRGKRYSLLEFTPYSSGRIRILSDGDGLVFSADKEAPDFRINRKSLRGSMNGDLVLLRPEKDRGQVREVRGRRVIDAEVMRVLQRAHRTVVGRFHAEPDQPYVVPFDFRIDHDIVIDDDGTMDARDGEMVNVEIDRYPDRSATSRRGRVVEVLGFIGEPGVDIEVVIRKFHIPHVFPAGGARARPMPLPDEVTPDEIAETRRSARAQHRHHRRRDRERFRRRRRSAASSRTATTSSACTSPTSRTT